jgi:hypothetical protein
LLKKTKMKKRIFTTLSLTCFLISASPISEALNASQLAGLTVNSGGDIEIFAPDSINFQSIFAETATEASFISNYTTDNQRFGITDTRNSGGFSLDLQFSNLALETNPSAQIPYQNFSFFTFGSPSSTNGIDKTPNNIADDVFAPFNYDWNFEDPIDNLAYTNTTGIDPNMSTPFVILNGEDPINAGRLGSYAVFMGIKLSLQANQDIGDYNGEMILTLNI